MSADDLIADYMVHLKERSCTGATRDAYAYQLTRADQSLEYGLDGSNEHELRAWIWSGELAPASRALRRDAVTGFFTWALRSGHIDFNPAAEIPRPKVPLTLPRVATDEHVNMLVNYGREPYRLWATLAAYGGLRCIEVFRQTREQITEERIMIFGKGDKWRAVPTHPVLWEVVKDLPPGPVTTAPSERRISTNFQRYCVNEALIPMSMHPLRAWFATTMYRFTKDLRAVSFALGHANLAVTARYLGMGQDEVRAAVNALPVLGGPGAGSGPGPAAVLSQLRSQLLGGASAPVEAGPDEQRRPLRPRRGQG